MILRTWIGGSSADSNGVVKRGGLAWCGASSDLFAGGDTLAFVLDCIA